MNDEFAINGTFLWSPDNYQEIPAPVVGYTLARQPVIQGDPTFVFLFSLIRRDAIKLLLMVRGTIQALDNRLVQFTRCLGHPTSR